MVTNKQRQRQLARAKWERQRSRRTRVASRQRTITIVVGVIVGLIVAALLVWLVLHLIDEENSRDPQSPSVPTESFVTDLPTPTANTGGSVPTDGPTDQQPSKTKSSDKPKATTTGGNG